jgi:hypothetical protein
MYVSIAVVAVVTIAVLVFLYLSRARWHWLHLTLLFLIYATGLFGAVMMSRSYKINSAWKQAYAKLESTNETLKKQTDEVLYGPQDSITPGRGSLRGITAALDLEMYGRGRSWERVTAARQDNQYTITLPATSATGGDAVDAAEQLHDGMFVFVFQDSEVPGYAGSMAGTKFLGTMSVTSTTGNQVTLAPVLTLDMEARSVVMDPATNRPQLDAEGKPQVVSAPVFPEAAQALAEPSGTWTLFEIMPVDMRDAFKRAAGIEVDPQQENVDFNDYQARYRTVLQEFMPPAMFNLTLDDPAQAAIYERLIDRHAFDMMRLPDINRWLQEHAAERISTTFEPLAEEKFSRLRFNERSAEFEIDTDAGTIVDGVFDIQGRAVLQELKFGSKVRLEKDAVIIVDPETATRWKERENVTEEAEVYVRQLDDFSTLISEMDRQRNRLFDSMLSLINEISVLRATDADLQTQERQRNTLVAQLTQDSENLGKDLEMINQLLASRTTEVADLKEQINKLYKVINVRYQQIKERSEQIMQTAR